MDGFLKKEMTVRTTGRSQMVDLTEDLRRLVREERLEEGRLTVFVPHTTAAVTINESADPAVAEDILAHLDRMIPWSHGWRHSEGNSAAHIKASLFGSSVVVTVTGGSLDLGTWQGVFFCEFDGPRERKVWVSGEPSG